MALIEEEKVRIRYHLGYLNVTAASSMHFGVPAPGQLLFLLESSMTRLIEGILPKVRQILETLECIECRLAEAAGDLAVGRISGGTEINLKQPDDLEREYQRWAKRLADILGVVPNPYSQRFSQASGNGINIGVR